MSMEIPLLLCLSRKINVCICLGIFFKRPTAAIAFGKSGTVLMQNPLGLPNKTTLECPKVVQTFSVFSYLTSKFASHNNAVHLSNISLSKTVPTDGDGLNIYAKLTSKRALRYNGVHFFAISTSKTFPRQQ